MTQPRRCLRAQLLVVLLVHLPFPVDPRVKVVYRSLNFLVASRSDNSRKGECMNLVTLLSLCSKFQETDGSRGAGGK